jgi:hypothetical protein
MLPTLDQLRENFRIDENDGEPEIIAKVEHGMRRLGGLEAEIPYIRYLLAVDPGDPAVLAMDAGARRSRIFYALRALALCGAGLRPLVLVFEDMHWADSSTHEYLVFLMDSVAGARLMLILTHRLEYTPKFGIKSFHGTINLRHLTDEQTLEMASRFLGSELFPEELKAALMQKAEGVPLFVEEVTKTLLDLGFITRQLRSLGGLFDIGTAPVKAWSISLTRAWPRSCSRPSPRACSVRAYHWRARSCKSSWSCVRSSPCSMRRVPKSSPCRNMAFSRSVIYPPPGEDFRGVESQHHLELRAAVIHLL